MSSASRIGQSRVFHDLVARRRPVISRCEEPAIGVCGPGCAILFQHNCQGVGESHRRRACLALCGLCLSIPCGAADVDALVIEVDVGPLQPERLASTQSREYQDDKERAPRLSCKRENRFDLGTGEVSGDVCVSVRKDELAKLHFPARISPVCCGREHRREGAQNIQHCFPRHAGQLRPAA